MDRQASDDEDGLWRKLQKRQTLSQRRKTGVLFQEEDFVTRVREEVEAQHAGEKGIFFQSQLHGNGNVEEDDQVQGEEEARLQMEAKRNAGEQARRQRRFTTSPNTEVSLGAPHAALRLERSERSKRRATSVDEVALRVLDAHGEIPGTDIAEMGARLRGGLHKISHGHAHEIAYVNDESHAKHDQHAETVASGLRTMLESENKLQVEMSELKSGIDDRHNSLIDNLTYVAQRVDMLTVALEKVDELRMAMESRFETTSEHLRTDLQTSVRDVLARQDARESTHSKLQEEFRLLKSGYTDNFSELSQALVDANQRAGNLDQILLKEREFLENRLNSIQASMEAAQLEMHTALRLELAEHAQAQSRALAAHAETHRVTMAEMEAQLGRDLHKGISHSRMRAESFDPGPGGDGSPSSLNGNLADVMQRLDLLAIDLDKEQKLRMSMDIKFDSMCEQLRTDLQIEIRGKIAAVSSEQNERHVQTAARVDANIQSALDDTHTKLQAELKLLRTHADSIADLNQVLRILTERVDDLDTTMQKKHVAVEARMVSMFSEREQVLLELQKELRTSEHDNVVRNLSDSLASHGQAHSKVVADLEKQLRSDLMKIAKEAERRHGELEERVSQYMSLLETFSDNQAAHGNVHELHSSLQAVKEHIAALERHMNTQSESSNAFHAQLNGEITDLHSSLQEDKSDLAGVDERMAALERQLNTQSEFNNALHAQWHELHSSLQGDKSKIEVHHSSVNERMAALERGLNTQSESNNAFHARLNGEMQDLHSSLQGDKSKIEVHHASVNECIAALERQLNTQSESSNALRAQLNGETLFEKIQPSLEKRLTKMQAYYSDITDKHATDLENAHSTLRKALSQFDEQWVGHERNKSILEQRLQQIDQAVLEQADANARALSQARAHFQNEHGKEVTELLQKERLAREAQEKNFLDYIADIMLQDRTSRVRAGSTFERRFESLELAMQIERSDRSQELKQIWDAFEGHTHDTGSPARELTTVVREVPHVIRESPAVVRQTSVPSPSAIMSPRNVHSILPVSSVSPMSLLNRGRMNVAPEMVERRILSPDRIASPATVTPKTPRAPWASPPHPPSGAASVTSPALHLASQGPPSMAGSSMSLKAAPVAATRALPMASVTVTGVDMNRDGIPDVLQAGSMSLQTPI